MRLEPEVWDALREICLREGVDLRDLMLMVERGASGGGRTSAVRVHVLRYYRDAATDAGHIAAGHGTGNASGPLRFGDEFAIDMDDVPQCSPPAPPSMVAELADAT